MKKTWQALFMMLILALSGCREAAVEIQNEDDGKLRIDQQHIIDFYLGNDEEGAGPITEQCLAIIGDSKPDSMRTLDEFIKGEEYAYLVNGVCIHILRYGAKPDEELVMTYMDLDANHILSNGIRIGSTEQELKQSYEDNPNFWYCGEDTERESSCYILYGEWHERYLIAFEVDRKTERIKSISYELDI